MSLPNIASVSWPDHLTFGEGDGRLATPAALRRRILRWRDELGVGCLHWRHFRGRIPGRFHAGRGRQHPTVTAASGIDWNDLAVVPEIAHQAGLRAYLYVWIFDEGWPLARPAVRERSFHNRMHGQHVSWQSAFTQDHPEYVVADRARRRRQWGVPCLAYPEVRRELVGRFDGLLSQGDFDGLFVCLRSQSRPADHADQFGFNRPARDEFRCRTGRDVWREDFDVQAWREHLGGYLTRFLTELRESVGTSADLAVGCARGNVVGPPIGNITLDWRTWVEKRIADDLVIGQNSSRCPSMWHQLWPMHHGRGYVQDYLDGANLPPLEKHLRESYCPVLEGGDAALHVARQWHHRDPAAERRLLAVPGVTGLVFSSFRHDNPGPLARNDWRA